jgi:hypothetical protein
MPAPFQKSGIGPTAVQLTVDPVAVRNTVTVKALVANAGRVYVGFQGVTADDGFELSAGDSVTIPVAVVATADLLYAVGSAPGQAVCVWVV